MGELFKKIFAWFGTFLSAVKKADFEALRTVVMGKVDKSDFEIRHSELREDLSRMEMTFQNALESHGAQARVDAREMREMIQKSNDKMNDKMDSFIQLALSNQARRGDGFK